MSKTLKTAEKTFATLTGLHAVLGATFPCNWAAYRAEMVGTYKVDAAMLDTLARLGHFRTTATTVRFLGA